MTCLNHMLKMVYEFFVKFQGQHNFRYTSGKQDPKPLDGPLR